MLLSKCSVLFLLLFWFSPLFAESLINDSLRLTNPNKTLIDKSLRLIDSNKALVDKSLRLTDNKKTLVDKEKSLTPIDENAVGPYKKTVYSTYESTTQNTVQDTRVSTIEDSYINNYGAFLNAVSSVNPQAKSKFVTYFTDWQWSGQKENFFSYSASRAELEKQIEHCYDEAIKKFGEGTAIVASTWVVAFIVPGGTIYEAAVLVVAKSTTWGAVTGAFFDGVFFGGAAALAGKNSDEIIYETINGAADGFQFGAAVGLAGGTLHVGILAKNAKHIAQESYILFGGKLYDKSKNLVLDLTEFSEGNAAKILSYLEKGDDVTKAFAKFNTDYKKLNTLRLGLEKGTISNEAFWERVVENGWSTEICEGVIKGQTDFGKYLRNLIGPAPNGMIDPHAHHILPKVGKGSVQQSLVEDGQKILRSYNIDPILGKENLCWAPNKVVGQHSKEAIKEIVDGLRILNESGATRGEIVSFLEEMGQKAAKIGL